MKILIVSTFFPPLNSIASLRPYSWAKYWSLAGHEVTVLTSVKNEDPEVALNYSTDSFEVIEVPLPSLFNRLKKKNQSVALSAGKKSWLSNALDYLRFKKGILNAARMPDIADAWAIKAYKIVKNLGQEWDLVISTAGPYSVHFVGSKLKQKKLAKKWIADYRDTWSNNYIYPGIFPFNAVEKWLEKRLLKKADLVTTVSDPFAESFKKQFSVKNVKTVANGFDSSDIESLPKEPIFFKDGKYRIVHTGSIYLGKRDPTPLFQALQEICQDADTSPLLNKLEVVFAGPRQANLEALIAHYQVGKWVKITGFVSRDDALRMQRDADSLLFLAWNDPSIDGVLTGKIFEYLFAKTPIWAIGASELEASQRLILDAGAGYALGSVDTIKKHLIAVLKKEKQEKLPFYEHILSQFDRKKLAEQLLETVSQ